MSEVRGHSTGSGSGGGGTSRLISAGAVMAAGTLVSRILGFGRLMLLVVLFGNGTRQADMFTYANTVPNSMYILLAGGVLNTVLVPQIVRAIKGDADGGEAYTNRIMTGGLLVLGGITVALTLAAPLVIGLYTPANWHTPARAAQYDSIVTLAYYCLPQIFFYGVHVLAGQILNARDRFGPMMWAPIANNVISIAVLAIFWLVFGQGDKVSAFTTGEELLLGLGSTLGIAAQAVVLIPFLRAAGYRFRPRFDFAHTGLGKTFRLAKWTLGFVIVTQAALVVVSRVAGSATASGVGAGLTVYYNAYAVWILPHSLITVSLATAMLPSASRLAAAGDLDGVRTETLRTMRLAVTALLPASVALFALGLPVARLAFGVGRGVADAELVGWALMALAIGLVPFTVQYICLRAFYALEDTRTTFLLQLVISAVNVGLALLVVSALDRPALVATGLALAYSGAYIVGVVISFRVLASRLPGLSGKALVHHCIRLLIAVAPAGGIGYGICAAFRVWSDGKAVQVLALLVAGAVAVAVFVALARLLVIREVNEIVGTVFAKLGPGRHALADVGSQPNTPDDTPGDAGDPGSPGDSTAVTAAVSGKIDPAGSRPPTFPTQDNRNAESMVSQPDEPGTRSADGAPEGSGHGSSEPDSATRVVPPVAATIPAGTVLGHRYRLEELLEHSQPTVTWRAFDQVLSRSVLVHLLPPADPGASELLDAARRASSATDSRFLRVLDAVHSDGPDLGSYIVCEYATGQSLKQILLQGPLSGLEAAWLIREVADALSGAHTFGLFHQRINPDTVIVTPTGNVKIVGLLIESVLRRSQSSPVHGADTPEMIDVTDLGRLLYAALVSRWPGGPAFGLPDAPALGQRWMTPRQVRAGVSPALDQVCDQILGEPPRHRAAPITSANDVVNALTKVLGSADASGDLERRLRQPIPQVRTTPGAPVASMLDQRTQLQARIDPTSASPDDTQLHGPPPGRVQREADETQPRIASGGAASGSAAITGTESSQTTHIRQPPPPTPAGRGNGSAGVPRVPATRPPGRSRRWILLVALLAVVLVGAAVISLLVLNGRVAGPGPSPGQSSQSPSAPTSTTVGPPGVVRISQARDFDPEGNKSENPDEVGRAFDGDPKTRWRTVSYIGNPKLGGIKRGVGLVLDLGQPHSVSSLKLSLSGNSTTVQARVPKGDAAQVTSPPMGSASRWTTVAEQVKAGSEATLTLSQPVTTRFVLVYLTSLPKEGSGYRGGIYEVQVLG